LENEMVIAQAGIKETEGKVAGVVAEKAARP
jgi:hypothetical protein